MSITVAGLVARSWSRPQVVGHRGASAHEVENTPASFEACIQSGAPAAECDVRLSRDGELVLVHDPVVEGKWVRDLSAACLHALGVSTLDEVLSITKDRSVLAVEIKQGNGIEESLAVLLTRRGLVDQVMVFAFDSRRVAMAVEACPTLFAVWLVGRPLEHWNFPELFARLSEIGASGLGIDYRYLTANLIAAAHSRGIPIFSWTVPPGPEADRVRDLGVNFIITDYPAEVSAQ
ncbi:glycerophosphodiester phosphodiesterase [Fimbriimonas ginsengisoli]|uniref:Glycerophosphoryl diester phosphodiesterase n=1 Tax=Fimbriimonas ginsengisoli Gsoil 348 TaxID=661478 RepID=A0A068NS27_FIMGI|nr:glycerophosphodiester phosphodiesterase [Fimbriimonas ginsengisoli]AIE86251.1 glycerophosphoryl diester phosphodiesterase [Fimbriimonas ginsengisoli Gsoil 348]